MERLTYTVTVCVDKAGMRLDRLLADAIPDLSRARLRQIIEAGEVCCARIAVTAADRRVHAGEIYEVRLPPPELASAAAEAMPLVIVYEDADVIVVDKPAGLVVHPGAGNADGTLVNGLLAHCPQGLAATGLPLRPGIVHRLDKDTSGLIVVAKTDRAHRTLTQQFALHSVERAYWAFVWGVPSPSTGRIETRIGRSPGNRLRMAVLPAGGKRAITHFRTVRTFGTVAALLECRLATGRTHQIRVHMAATGHPLIGDAVYGLGGRGSNATGTAETVQSRLRAFPRQALHAYLLGFRHPEDGAEHRFCSELPNDLVALQDLLEDV